MTNDERIEAKRTELMETFASMPPEQLKVAADLIGQAAFLAVSLEDLSEVIAKEGMTEEYTNGANQSGRKISSNAKMYSSLIGKYNTIVMKLLKIVPPKPDNKERDKEIARKIEELEKDRQNAYAQMAHDAFLEAKRQGKADAEHYTDFMDQWRADNPYDAFTIQEE